MPYNTPDSGFRLIKFQDLFTECLERNQPINVPKMYLKLVHVDLCAVRVHNTKQRNDLNYTCRKSLVDLMILAGDQSSPI